MAFIERQKNVDLRSNLKAVVQRCLSISGYRLEKIRGTVRAPIDVFEILLKKLSSEREDFFFVQVGANDGLTDDPLRAFVTRYHWRGLLIEPQPQVFRQLLKNYEQEKQLIFENAALADKDGSVRFYVASHGTQANLTVFSSLKKSSVKRGLNHPKANGVKVQVQEVEAPAVSVPTLLAKHRITEIDLLLTDVQGYDCEVVEQFLTSGVNPTIIHFEHCHASRPALDALYRKLIERGYRFIELPNDTLCCRFDIPTA